MENQLNNMVTAVGTYNGVSTSLSSNVVAVTMISGLTVTKTADKPSWADGVLTYTITLENKAVSNYVSPVISDVIDTTLVNFIADSVTIDGTKADASKYEYNTDTHTLTVTLGDLTPSATSVVQFQVEKKA